MVPLTLRSMSFWSLDYKNFFFLFLTSAVNSLESANKGLEVQTYYKVLQPSHICEMSFPWILVRKSKVHTKVRFFTRTTTLGRILTNDNLRKHWLLAIDWCCICKRDGETSNHLFLHCSLARELWSTVFSLFGVAWVMPNVRLGTAYLAFVENFLLKVC